jgi:CRISPR/Cas system-associated endoribonuclease Cas2
VAKHPWRRRRSRLSSRESRIVFEFDLNPKEANVMMLRVATLINEEEDAVRLLRLCAACLGEARILGEGALSLDPDYYII